LDQFASSYGLLEEVDWPGIVSSFYETVRMRIKCREASKIPRERLFCIDKKLYKIVISVEVPKAPVLEIKKLGGKDDLDKHDGGDDEDNLDDYDDLEDEEQSYENMNVDKNDK
jgi:hypothetical protein